ncbi:MAG: DNA-directed RNA polymerase subunit omega [Fimbriimonadaceae bacterium]|nr:DNA-directed RNA polymerase subunit omega [Fimbriimonadaceae bacterium]
MVQGEKILPHPDVLNEAEYGRFVLVNLAAKRARQIKDGAPPLVRIDSGHPVSIALAEIAAGKLRPHFTSETEDAQAAAEHLATLEGLEIGDMGLLLPSLEEDVDLHTDEEEEDSLEDDLHSISLDLHDPDQEGEIEEEVEAGTNAGDLSLDDLAESEEEDSDSDGDEA